MILSIYYAGQEIEISFVHENTVINRLFLADYNLSKRLKEIVRILPKTINAVVTHYSHDPDKNKRKITAIFRFVDKVQRLGKISRRVYQMDDVITHYNHYPDPNYYAPADWLGLYHQYQQELKALQAFEKTLPYKD